VTNAGARLRQSVVDYGREVTATELTGAPPGRVDHGPASAAMEDIYRRMLAVADGPGGALSSAQPAWDAIVGLDAARGTRLMLSRNALPVQFWVVLIFGAAVSIVSLVAILPRSGYIHIGLSVAATLMIVLMLLLLSDLNRPFEGPSTVDFSNYRAAVENLGQSVAGTAP